MTVFKLYNTTLRNMESVLHFQAPKALVKYSVFFSFKFFLSELPCSSFKTSLNATHFRWRWIWSAWKWTFGETHLYMNAFAQSMIQFGRAKGQLGNSISLFMNFQWRWIWTMTIRTDCDIDITKFLLKKGPEGRGPMITSLPTYPWLYSFSAIFMVSFAFIFNFLDASFSSSYKCKGYMSRVNLIFIYTVPVIATGFVSVGKFSSYCKNKWKVLKIELFACHEILAFKNYLLLAGLKCVTCRLNQFKAEMPQFTWIIILCHDCLIFKNPSVIPVIKLFQNDQHRYHYNTSNLLTTVSKGSGLHLLLGWDEVLWTLAVGFLQRKNSIDQQIYSKH